MTSISVHTGALTGAAARLQGLGGDTGQRARAVDSVQRGLALQIEARQQFDQRLRALSAKLNSQANALSGHSRFLAMAAARYEAAETTTQQRAPRDAPQAGASQGLAAAFGKVAAEYAKLVHNTDLFSVPMSPLVILSMLAAAGEDRLDGWAEAHDYKLVVGAVDLAGEIPGVGTVLTLGEVELDLKRGDLVDAAWATRGFIPGDGALEGGIEIGTFLAEQGLVNTWAIGQIQGAGGWAPKNPGITGWVTGQVQGADGWAPNYDHLGVDLSVTGATGWAIGRVQGADGWAPSGDHASVNLDVGDLASDTEAGVKAEASGVWDWVTCR